MQDHFQLWRGIRSFHIREAETLILPEANDKNPLPVLRRPVPPVDHAEVDCVFQIFLEHVFDRLERLPLVVTDQVSDVFQQEGGRRCESGGRCP